MHVNSELTNPRKYDGQIPYLGKFMPAGIVATLGAVGLAYNVNKAIEWAPSKDGE